ncbi:MAG: zinc ribbon domain-containing protein [Atopobiaceae bacterium]|nr:zinc ribbon domain-containing protein [Atopobiaceae bacterium]
MKLIALNCPSCGGRLEIEPGRERIFCTYCGAQIFVDDEVQRVEHMVNYANAEDAGYQFEKGRQRAIAEAAQQPIVQPVAQPVYQPVPKKKRRTWLWVLGWIFIFPVPLTIIMLNKKDVKPAVRYAIIALAWILYIGWVNSSD